MRVAVRHTDESHPNGQWFAFGEGRILGFTDPISGQSYSREQVAEALLKRAKEHFPKKDGYEHRIETLHTTGSDLDGNDESTWFEAGTSDLPRTGDGGTTEHNLEAQQGQEGTA